MPSSPRPKMPRTVWVLGFVSLLMDMSSEIYHALLKPLFPLAQGAFALMGARFMDRVGKGIRGSPRDAMVADETPPEIRGAAFGLRQAMDTVGALIAPVLAIALMWLLANNIRAVFWIAVIPALLSFLLSWLVLR